MALMSSRLYRHFRKSSGARNSHGILAEKIKSGGLSYINDIRSQNVTEKIVSEHFSSLRPLMNLVFFLIRDLMEASGLLFKEQSIFVQYLLLQLRGTH